MEKLIVKVERRFLKNSEKFWKLLEKVYKLNTISIEEQQAFLTSLDKTLLSPGKTQQTLFAGIRKVEQLEGTEESSLTFY